MPDGSYAPKLPLLAAPADPTAAELSDRALHQRYAHRIDRIVGALVGQDSEREDFVHETLIRVFQQVGCVRDPSRLDQWVYRVTLNTVWGAIRRRRRGRFIPLDGLSGPEEPALDVDMEGRELAQRTARVIDRLPLADRQLLMRHWFEPKNPRQLAEGIGCATVTVKRKLKRARARFHRLANADRVLGSALVTGD